MSIGLKQKILELSTTIKETNSVVLNEENAVLVSNLFNLPLKSVYIEALKLEISPLRYLKNRTTISFAEQITLAESTVTVAGAGGLGEYVIHLLARIGIGTICFFDNDSFDESNLNRQLFSSTKNIGKFKTDVIKQIINLINPAVNTTAYTEKIVAKKVKLDKPDVIVDALDNSEDRLLLAKLSEELCLPLVHGSIAGFEGRILTQYPGGKGIKTLFTGETDNISSEKILGTPAITPCIIGSLQAMEVIKILLNKDNVFKDTMLYFNPENLTSSRFTF